MPLPLDHIAFLFETAQPSAQARLAQLPALRAAINGGNAGSSLVLDHRPLVADIEVTP